MEINGWKGEQYFDSVTFASFDLPLSQINDANVAEDQDSNVIIKSRFETSNWSV